MSFYNNIEVATLNFRGIARRKKQILLKRILFEEGIDVFVV